LQTLTGFSNLAVHAFEAKAEIQFTVGVDYYYGNKNQQS
jgi:hypothetical protein